MSSFQELQTTLINTGKRWLSIAPVAFEMSLAFLVIFLIHSVANRARALKHSCFHHNVWRVHRERAPPSDMLAGKFFQNEHGLWLHYRVWWKDVDKIDELAKKMKSIKPKGLILLIHGMSEHIDRHAHTAEFYVEKGYLVLGLDHQGFGRSEGDRAHVESFDDYCQDILYFLGTFIPERFPTLVDVPKFIQAHSMGGLITFHTAIRAQKSTNPWHKLSGIVLGNAMITPGRLPFHLKVIFTILDLFVPKWGIFNFPSAKSTNFLSAKQQSFFDPVNYGGGLRPHQVFELLKAEEKTKDLAAELKTPTYLFHGTIDLTTNPEGSKILYENAKAANPDLDIVLNELEGMYHEPLQEEEHIRIPILETIEAWIESKCS